MSTKGITESKVEQLKVLVGPVKLSFKVRKEIKNFSNKNEFVASRHDLQEY